MISTKTLLQWLTVLVSLDTILTILSVGWMGATELNVFFASLGFAGFMALKIIGSAVVIYVAYKYCIPSIPTLARCWLVMFGIVYMAFCASNAYQLAGAVA